MLSSRNSRMGELKDIKRRKWVRKAPLLSTSQSQREKRSHPGSMRMENMMIVSGRKGQENSYDDLRSSLLTFLNGVTSQPWGADEKFKRFYIFGEYITCARWEGKCYITGPDVFKVQCALYRIEHRQPVPTRRKFEEVILTQLRGIGSDGMRIEPSGSPFIGHLHKIGAIRTRKRQKVFEWHAVKHEELYEGKISPLGKKKADAKAGGNNNKKMLISGGYVIKSMKIYEKPEMSALLNAIEMVENVSQASDSSFSI